MDTTARCDAGLAARLSIPPTCTSISFRVTEALQVGRCPVGFHKPDPSDSIPGPATELVSGQRAAVIGTGLRWQTSDAARQPAPWRMTTARSAIRRELRQHYATIVHQKQSFSSPRHPTWSGISEAGDVQHMARHPMWSGISKAG